MCRPVSADTRSACARTRARAGSETRPWVACAALDENAKAITEASLQTPISTPGGFVGTPEFASPEQFAGVGVGIRSDSLLAVTLWEMLTGTTPCRGIPGEVMCQHSARALTT